MFATPAYRKYMSKVQPGYSPPCTNTVKKYLRLEYVHEKAALKQDLKGQVAVALTCDAWTSTTTQSYLTVTGHYISEDWVLQHVVLGTKRMIGRHSGEHIYESLASVVEDCGVEGKVAGLTSDNASNIKSAARKQQFITCDEAHVQCFAHTLQLAVED